LVEGDLVLGRDLARELAVRNRDPGLHDGLLHSGALGDLRNRQSLERQLLEHGCALRLGEAGPVLVLGELLQQPGHGGVVALHDVGGNRSQPDLACGENSALADAQGHGAVLVPAASDGGEDSELSDRREERGVPFYGGADVGFDLDPGGVDVLDRAERCRV
jgi:hypothetical protein